MTQLTTLDTAELTGWLTRTTQAIDRSLRDTARSDATSVLGGGLGGTKVGLPILTQLALLDDCLRVAHLAIEADGVIEPSELARIADLVRVAAPKYFAVLPQYEAFDDGARSEADITRFLRQHRADPGPFGFANADHWRGLHLARRVEQHTRNASPLREHERMLARVMDEVFDGRSTDVERSARRRLRELFEPVPTAGLDPRAAAFCRADGPEVFASVAHGSQIHTRDLFDVDAIHAEARDALHRLADRATTPANHEEGFGRTLLVLGESGAGKTHLLRAFRTQVHSQRMGYVGYLQMTVEVGDYSRYVLRSLIDSLERPYDAPGLSESALMYLSDGVAEGRAMIPKADLEQLRSADLTPEQLEPLLGRCVDRVIRTDGLGELDHELLHALLLLQRRDPAVQRRVVRFLRCEALGNYDRQILGGLTGREQPDDPMRTIRGLANIMYELHFAALVLLVDQIEDAIPDGHTVTRIQQAFDSLRAIADAVPSAVVVISCLEDVYDAIAPKLGRALRDRIEHDPPPVRLSSEREVDEIEQMLVRRLESLYTTLDVPWREDDPLFPFTAAQINAVGKLRARDCLARFRDYHNACIAARSIIGSAPGTIAAPPPSPPPPEASTDARIDQLWNNGNASETELPDDDDGILELVEAALRGLELELELGIVPRRVVTGIAIESRALPRRIASICNGRGQGNHLGRQLEALRSAANAGTIPIAIRSSDWQFKPKQTTAQRVAEFKQAGGRTVVIEEHELRAIAVWVGIGKLAPPGLDSWRHTRKPLSQLPVLRELLDLDRVTVAPPAPVATPPASVSPPTPAPTPTPPSRISAPVVAFEPAQIRLGTLTTIRAEPVALALEQIKKHVAFLGSPGSGKTTVALSVTEQLLERGISVLLVDRKGDLSRYASDAWWSDAAAGDPARKAHLRERVRVSLYTPGNPHGRPLRLPLVPSLRDATAQDRDQLAKFAASGLTAMMGLGRGISTTHKESVLKCAIELLADEHEITLEMLHATISRPDPQLLLAVDALQKHFASLAECLQSLRIQKGTLLSGEGETLEIGELLPPPGDRPRLTIINTSAFTEVPVLQFWVSRLLGELSRLARKRPSATLQAAAFFDEADAYIPAIGSPPTKEPMFDLLRRARSGGYGIMLATQNPGDFDYKARDNIGTWLVGKVAQDRAIEKMRNLLGQYPDVGHRLASQAPGAFFVLADGPPKEIRADRALMSTEQMADDEVVALAKANATKR